MSRRSEALAQRLEQGAAALAAFASTLSEAEWQTRVPHDGRKVGVTVHHVASMYPIEMQVTQIIAAGKPIEGVTPQVVAEINAKHAREFDGVTRDQALELLRKNSAAAAAGIRALSDTQLDQAAAVSYSSDAPLTCQFWVEDHPVRHSFHHLARLKAAVALVRVAS
jgi:DinB family protein